MATLTQAELAILREIWQMDAATVRRLAEAIYGNSEDSKTAAILKLLQRMVTKGVVACQRDERPHVYLATMTEQKYLQRQLQNLADEHCGGKLAPLATTLVQAKGFTKRQRRQLRDLIDRTWPDNNGSDGDARHG